MVKEIEARVEELMLEIIAGTEFELVDVEYVIERDWYLRVFMDKAGGIDLDDCQQLSEKLGKILDHEPLIDGPYILEVSSPGIDRVLKKDRDFVREAGKAVDVTLYAPFNGEKKFTGILVGRDKTSLKLEDLEIPREQVAQVRLHIDF